jgi:hypothetical protein
LPIKRQEKILATVCLDIKLCDNFMAMHVASQQLRHIWLVCGGFSPGRLGRKENASQALEKLKRRRTMAPVEGWFRCAEASLRR